jgi:hypothetical protein
MNDELDVLTRLIDYHDHITAPEVPVAEDLRRGRRRVVRRRALTVGGVAAAAAVVVLTASLLTRAGTDTEPPQPAPSPTETPTDGTTRTSAPVDLPANGRLVRAEEEFTRALEPCTIVTADYELVDRGADCSIRAQDVDVTTGIGLFEETPTNAGGNGYTTTLRVATPDEVLGRFPSPQEDGDAELGPGADEISLAAGQEITVLGFDGRVQRSIDLSAVLAPAQTERPAEEIISLEWSPDRRRVAVVTRYFGDDGLVTHLWVVDRDGGEPQLVHTATNTLDVPANKTPLSYVWSVTWSPDGGSLGFIEEFAYIGGYEQSQSIRAATLTLSVSGQDVPRTMYDYPSSTAYDEAEILWSPDGTRVALRVPDQVLELSVEDGSVLDRYPMIAGKMIWFGREAK